LVDQWIKIGNISNGGQYIGLPAKGDKLTIDRNVTVEHYINSIHAQDAILHKVDAKGELELPLKPKDGIDELIFALFGQVEITDNGDGTYTHKFTAKPSDIPEFEVIKNIGSVQEKYTGCKATKLSIKTPANGDVELTVEIIAKDGQPVTGETAPTLYDKSRTFRVVGGTVTWGGNTYAIGNVELTFERDAADDGFTISADNGRSLIPEGKFKVTAKIDVLADDVTFITDFMAGTQKPFVLTLQTPDGETIEFHIPNAVIVKRDKATQVDKKLIVENVEIAGLDDGTNGAGYIVLTNDVSTYPRT